MCDKTFPQDQAIIDINRSNILYIYWNYPLNRDKIIVNKYDIMTNKLWNIQNEHGVLREQDCDNFAWNLKWDLKEIKSELRANLYFKSKKIMVCFDEKYHHQCFRTVKSIILHAKKIDDKQLKRFGSCELPIIITKFGYILSYNEQYIVLFGGLKEVKFNEYKSTDNIYILDLIKNEWFKSKIKIPTKSFPIMVTNIIKMDDDVFILINGYIRVTLNIANIPKVIVDIIGKYFGGFEYIHLINETYKWRRCKYEHWEIRLSELIQQSDKV